MHIGLGKPMILDVADGYSMVHSPSGLELRLGPSQIPNSFLAFAPHDRICYVFSSDLRVIHSFDLRHAVSLLSSVLMLSTSQYIVCDWSRPCLFMVDATGSLQGTRKLSLPRQQHPEGIVKLCTLDQSRIAVLARTHLLLYDLNADQLFASRPLDPQYHGFPSDMAYDPKRELLFVADIKSHTVVAYGTDLSLRNVYGIPFHNSSEGTLFSPIALCLSDAADLYVAEMLGNCVRKLDPSTGSIRMFSDTYSVEGSATRLLRPSGLHSVVGRGLVVSTHYDRRPGVLLPEHRGWLKHLNGPRSADYRAGRLLVSDTYNNRVLELGGRGEILWSSLDARLNLLWPRCATYRDNLIGIADARNRRIVVLKDYQVYRSIEGYHEAGSFRPFGDLHWLDFVDDELIVVADSVLNRVLLLRIDGQLLASYDELSNPHSVRYYDGCFLVADTGHDRIVCLDRQLSLRHVQDKFMFGQGVTRLREPKYASNINTRFTLVVESAINQIGLLTLGTYEYCYRPENLTPNGAMFPRHAHYAAGYLLITDYFGSRIIRLRLNEQLARRIDTDLGNRQQPIETRIVQT